MITQSVGKLLIFAGIGIAAIGAILLYGGQSKWLRLGRLPGDIVYQKGSFSFYFPITTMILISAVVTLALWVVGHFRR